MISNRLWAQSKDLTVVALRILYERVREWLSRSLAAVAVVPLNSSNYSTWKIQCKMALVKEGLWGIVDGTETAPTEVAELAKFAARKNKALATIAFEVEPNLLYLVGADPSDPTV